MSTQIKRLALNPNCAGAQQHDQCWGYREQTLAVHRCECECHDENDYWDGKSA